MTVCLNFFDPKSHVLTIARPKVCLVSIKYNFLKKVVFYNCEENVQVQNGAPKDQVCGHFDISVGGDRAITKLRFNNLKHNQNTNSKT